MITNLIYNIIMNDTIMLWFFGIGFVVFIAEVGVYTYLKEKESESNTGN